MDPDPAQPPFVVSCEHAGRDIPPAFRPALTIPAEVLASHRGGDAGSREYGLRLARALGAPCQVNDVTRLLVDANRSAANPARFSSYARQLPGELLQLAVDEVWEPHRRAVEQLVRHALERGRPVVHLAAHSFTPVMDGIPRGVDVAFLYDPTRTAERERARHWQRLLARLRPDLRVRLNAPYRGTADGLTRTLRRVFQEAEYAGIEIEVSQRFPEDTSPAGRRTWRTLQDDLIQVLTGS